MPILSGAIEVRWLFLEGLEREDVAGIFDSGVYVVWHGGPRPRVIRVGHGTIADRLTAFRGDARMMAYRRFGPLHVAWADVPESQARGVAKFLGSRLRPVQEDPLVGIIAIPATLPF